MRRLWISAVSFGVLVAAFVGSLPADRATGNDRLPPWARGNHRAHGVIRLPNGTLVALERREAEGRANRELPGEVAGCANTFSAPGFPDNVRTTVDCAGAGQQEEWVAVNPTDPSNIVESHTGAFTGVDFSLQGGAPGSFGNSGVFTDLVPCDPRTRACGPSGLWSFDSFTDPTHAFDALGNLYFAAIGYDFRRFPVNGLYLWKGNACGKGRALGNPSDSQCFPTIGIPSVVHDNFANPHDQDQTPWVATGPRPGAPTRTQVAVAWLTTRFDCGPRGDDICEQPGFFSRSLDGGVTWTRGKEFTGRAPFCVGGDAFTGDPADAHACNFNDGRPYILVGPDGTIHVVWLNFNTPTLVNQNLYRSSRDGGKTWSRVRRVSDVATLEPWSIPGHRIPDCELFRQCLPPNGWRIAHFPSLGLNPVTGDLAVTWIDFRNGGHCHRAHGLPVVPCANYNEDVFVSTSSDRGVTWSQPKPVTEGLGSSAQWEVAGVSGDQPGELFASFYDRSYGSCEATGCNDVTLATSHDGGAHWTYRRITTSSMPDMTCAQNSLECGLLGDYQGLASFGGNAYLVWADTRGRGSNAPEMDVYFATVPGSP